jgi:glycosyltransferase involved in cell wall biosynthesis
MAQPIIIQWPLSSYTGWGVYALNLALSWAADAGLEAMGGSPVNLDRITIDPLRRQSLMQFIVRSLRLQQEFEKFANEVINLNVPVLVALGNGAQVGYRTAHNVVLQGAPTIGVIFFESAFDADGIQRAKRYPLIITGSHWNEALLRGYGVKRVRTVLQGIDPTNFHPGPRIGLMPERFLVFSGGNAEARKGQDLVLAAFRIFATRHPEALLVTAWHCPWPQIALSLDRSGKAAPVVFKDKGALDVTSWAAATGIPSKQVLDLGPVPNILMPPILREMNVAVFPNRAEGGTNLVAMECMACGVPVILSCNTGHRDLIEGENCYALDRQGPVPGAFTGVGGIEGWGESDVDEIVERLEQAFADQAEARRRGALGAKTLSVLTWFATARALKETLREMPGYDQSDTAATITMRVRRETRPISRAWTPDSLSTTPPASLTVEERNLVNWLEGQITIKRTSSSHVWSRLSRFLSRAISATQRTGSTF